MMDGISSRARERERDGIDSTIGTKHAMNHKRVARLGSGTVVPFVHADPERPLFRVVARGRPRPPNTRRNAKKNRRSPSRGGFFISLFVVTKKNEFCVVCEGGNL